MRAGIVPIAVLAAVAACSAAPRNDMRGNTSPMQAAQQELWSADVRDGYTRVRAATQPFHSLDSAVAAGYARDVPRCFADAHHGAMGFHHVNRSLVDDRVEIEKPEILLYERHPDGRYVLNGVEYIIPYTRWPRDSVAPRIMGVDLERADDLNLWYLHMWAWKPNPSGVFVGWNPMVRCPE